MTINPFIWADGSSYNYFRRIHLPDFSPEEKLDFILGAISEDRIGEFFTLLDGRVLASLTDDGKIQIVLGGEDEDEVETEICERIF